MSELAAVCPGDRLAPSAEFEAGLGTHLSKDGKHIYSSLVGLKEVVPATGKKATLQVVSQRSQVLTPSPGDVVTCKVTRINPRLASADIICVGTQPLEERFTGIIRLQDVRATEIDKIDIASCFRPGDIVRAHIVSLGTHRDYYLSTAKNELGVVYAKSLAGHPMVPLSWQEMQCPRTKAIEKRKVAKVKA